MREKVRREFTVEEKAAILAEYDHATTGTQRQSVLRKHGIAEAYIVRFRKQLSRTIATSHAIPTDAPKAKVVLKPNLTGDPLSLDLAALYAKMAKESLAGWYMDRGQLMDDRDKYLVIDAKEAIDSARAAIFKLVLAME